ncbi:MAG TPA: DUF4336 domain-containing protein [Polyangiales bacterium]|jgi:hypothetical protein
MPDAFLATLEQYVPQRLWLIEYPVRFGGMNLSARTTIVRLQAGELFVHSPCPIDAALQRRILSLGPVAHVIAPGTFHALHAAAWCRAFPDAQLWVCPGLERKRPELHGRVLSDEAPLDWHAEIAQAVVHGSRWMREVIFFERASHTLIATDIIENYGDHSANAPWMLRFWWRLLGTWNRPSPAPEYRFGWCDKRAARASLERVLGWDFERIVLSHGELIEHDARACARRAWQSLL